MSISRLCSVALVLLLAACDDDSSRTVAPPPAAAAPPDTTSPVFDTLADQTIMANTQSNPIIYTVSDNTSQTLVLTAS